MSLALKIIEYHHEFKFKGSIDYFCKIYKFYGMLNIDFRNPEYS